MGNCCWGQRYELHEDLPIHEPPCHQSLTQPPQKISATLTLRQVKGNTPDFSLFEPASSTYLEDLRKLNTHLDTLSKESNLPAWAYNFIHNKSAFNQTLPQYLSTLRKRREDSDVELAFGFRKVIKAHRDILSHRSAYFRTMFNSGMLEATQSKIEMEVETYKSMLQLVEYLYTDKISMADVNLLDLFHVLDVYAPEHVPLIQQCAQQMYTYELSPSNTCMVYEFARERDIKPLITACEYYIIMHLSEIDPIALEPHNITEMGLKMQKITLAAYDDHSYSPERSIDYKGSPIKTALYGIAKAGKSTLFKMLSQCVVDKNAPYLTTIGVEFGKYLWQDDSSHKPSCQIWDTGGDERFRVISRAYMRGTRFLVACFSFDDLASFEYIRYVF